MIQRLLDQDLSSVSADFGEMVWPLEQQGGCGLCCDPQAVLDDEFMMNRFKVEKCMSNSGHIWRNCPFVHPGEPVQRRHPSLHLPDLCPKVKQGAMCQHGPDNCCYAHNSFEAWLHPERFKTILCRKGAKCVRGVCFFAHSESELRAPTKAKPPGAELAAAAAAAATQKQQHNSKHTAERMSSNSSRFAGTAVDLPGQQLVSLGVPSSLSAVSPGIPQWQSPAVPAARPAMRSGINRSSRAIRASSNSSLLFGTAASTGSDVSSGGNGSGSGLNSPLTVPPATSAAAAAAVGSQLMGAQQLLHGSNKFELITRPVGGSSSSLLGLQSAGVAARQVVGLLDRYHMLGDVPPNMPATTAAAAGGPARPLQAAALQHQQQQQQQLGVDWDLLPHMLAQATAAVPSSTTATGTTGAAGTVTTGYFSQPWQLPMQQVQPQPQMLYPHMSEAPAAGGLQPLPADQQLLQQVQVLSLQQQQPLLLHQAAGQQGQMGSQRAVSPLLC